jgi:hypothetical protein
MPNDEASSGGDEVVVFDEADGEWDEPNVLGLVGGPLPKFSTGLSSATLAGLTGGLERLFASETVCPASSSQIFKDTIKSWAKVENQLGLMPHVAGAFGASSALSSFAATLTKDLKTFDQLSTGFMLTQRERALTAAWSKDVLGLSAMTSWRTSLAIESSFASLLKPFAEAQRFQSAWADDLLRITSAQVKLTDWAVSHDAGSRLLGATSGKPLILWQDYADLAPVSPDVQWLRTSVAAGNAGLGLLGADVLESDLDGELVQATVQQVELEVLVASEPGRLRTARELYARLGAIDSTVPELLEGAWEDIERNGPAAASKAAHCIVEGLDRTLRAAAPDDAVREWHTRTGRPATEFGNRGQVTRPLRVRYLASEIGGTRELVVAQYESLTGLLSPLHGRLEGVKHASTADVTLVRSLLLTAEGFLTLLFLSTMP